MKFLSLPILFLISTTAFSADFCNEKYGGARYSENDACKLGVRLEKFYKDDSDTATSTQDAIKNCTQVYSADQLKSACVWGILEKK